jgi:CRISPR-associated endonuclease Cas2
MGEVEKGAKKVRHRGEIEEALLAATAAAGLLAVALATPKALELLRYIPGNKQRFGYQAQSVVTRLAHKGHITFVESGGKKYIRLTSQGRVAFEFLQAKAAGHATNPKKWDRRFRMVIFDIPETKRLLRDRLRRVVAGAGFMRLQDSVWVYPYDCEELLVLLKANLRIGKDVLYVVVEKIENDRAIRQHFSLPID